MSQMVIFLQETVEMFYQVGVEGYVSFAVQNEFGNGREPVEHRTAAKKAYFRLAEIISMVREFQNFSQKSADGKGKHIEGGVRVNHGMFAFLAFLHKLNDIIVSLQTRPDKTLRHGMRMLIATLLSVDFMILGNFLMRFLDRRYIFRGLLQYSGARCM